jgi:hypothetical protein
MDMLMLIDMLLSKSLKSSRSALKIRKRNGFRLVFRCGVIVELG